MCHELGHQFTVTGSGESGNTGSMETKQIFYIIQRVIYYPWYVMQILFDHKTEDIYKMLSKVHFKKNYLWWDIYAQLDNTVGGVGIFIPNNCSSSPTLYTSKYSCITDCGVLTPFVINIWTRFVSSWCLAQFAIAGQYVTSCMDEHIYHQT